MSGILFLKTADLNKVTGFYLNQVGCTLWLDQPDCRIFRHGNFLFGFCKGEKADTNGILTFFYPTKEQVDSMYSALQDVAREKPKMNDKYKIYHFYAADPEGRDVEFQYFDHYLKGHLAGDDLLLTRRSMRKFLDQDVSDEVIRSIVDMTRFAPTSRNTQGFYFKIIRDTKIQKKLSGLRGKSSSPIANAPLAVAICSDPEITKRHIQDGCIGAYHFILSAWFHGLGTVWIAAMDRDDAKEMLGIPRDHYIATITPLGYPKESFKQPPERKGVDWYIR